MNNGVLIIAEAGVNHNGDVKVACQLIDAAQEAGVDIVKFQTWITEELVTKDAPKAEYQKANDGAENSQFDMLKKLELSFDDFRHLKDYAERKGVLFLSTPDDYKSLDFLSDKLDLPLLKIGSGEVTNIPFLRRFGRKKKQIILSTGMSTLEEVKLAYDTLIESGAKSVALLHCTSNYPAPLESVNLHAITTLASAFHTKVGYSDHTEGIEISVAAVAMGATIIEKHFTLDKKMQGPDHKASIDPSELKEMVRQIRNVEKALLGDGIKKPHQSEFETKKIVQKGIYLYKSVKAGEVITDEHLVMMRPVMELSATDFDKVIGKLALTDMEKGTPLSLNKLKER